VTYCSNLAWNINFSRQQINASVISNRNNILFGGQNTYYTLSKSNVLILSTDPGYKTLTDSRTEIKLVFDNFYEKWHEETKYLSSPTMMFENRYYKKIISLGMVVVPVIINKLKETPCHLFFALYKITGINPARPENRGNIEKMSNDWIAWWERKKNVRE
jgi:hypothetical protein